MRLLFNKKIIKNFRAALFLDRDGVINEDYGYVHHRENFHFKPGIFNLVCTANRAGFLCVIVTNQSGIGRGLYSFEQFRELSGWMCKQFEKKGAEIDAIYFSPFHPTEGKGKYLANENTRKPAPGMFYEAVSDFRIDLSKSIMVGDNISDMTASIKAGIGQSYLLRSSHHRLELKGLHKNITTTASLSHIASQLLK